MFHISGAGVFVNSLKPLRIFGESSRVVSIDRHTHFMDLPRVFVRIPRDGPPVGTTLDTGQSFARGHGTKERAKPFVVRSLGLSVFFFLGGYFTIGLPYYTCPVQCSAVQCSPV